MGGAGVYPKMPPMVEAMTMPRITQQMMIMIFFCRETKAGLRRAMGVPERRSQNEGSGWG